MKLLSKYTPEWIRNPKKTKEDKSRTQKYLNSDEDSDEIETDDDIRLKSDFD